jgi:hypothetical protein
MKRVLPRLIPMFFATIATASGGFLYQDLAGNLSLSAQGGRLDQAAGSYKFDLRGGVHAASKKQGLTIQARQVTGEAAQVAGSKQSETKIQHAIATGGSTLDSNRAEYTDRGADALVVMTGSVRVTNRDNHAHQTLVITGSSGQAILDPNTKGKSDDGLRTAAMEGNVRVQIDGAGKSGTKPTHITATGRRLVLDKLSSPATLTLTGGVEVRGSGTSGFSGTLQRAERVVMQLNSKLEVIGTEISS